MTIRVHALLSNSSNFDHLHIGCYMVGTHRYTYIGYILSTYIIPLCSIYIGS